MVPEFQAGEVECLPGGHRDPPGGRDVSRLALRLSSSFWDAFSMINFYKNLSSCTSLVVQWLRICLPMQDTQV